ncbi:MAG: IS200/IS605 family transposase [Dictyoglomaceae bacterium]
MEVHFVWSTKYRRKVLLPPVDASLKEAIIALCAEHGYELLSLGVMPDHVHVFLSAPPKVAPAVIAKVLKGGTARMLFEKHPELKRELWSGHLWNPSYVEGNKDYIHYAALLDPLASSILSPEKIHMMVEELLQAHHEYLKDLFRR